MRKRYFYGLPLDKEGRVQWEKTDGYVSPKKRKKAEAEASIFFLIIWWIIKWTFIIIFFIPIGIPYFLFKNNHNKAAWIYIFILVVITLLFGGLNAT